MGALLETPKVDKRTEHGFGNGLQFGVSSMQGWRVDMENTYCAVIGLEGLKNWSFFAVFDGHVGKVVSTYCAKHLLESIMQSNDFKQSASAFNNNCSIDSIEKIKNGIREGFLTLDENIKKLPEVISRNDISGSTAICVIISPSHFFFANCGDSRAVLSRKGKAYFATKDHKPSNPEEKKRIQKAGGKVMIHRINGSLAVSRALGDFDYKQHCEFGPCEQLVSPEPEITVQERDNELDEFLVLACDGIWDTISTVDLCNYTRYQLKISLDLKAIASSIIDTCLNRGSKDNMSVILIALPGAPTICEKTQKKDKELDQLIETKVQEFIKNNTQHSLPQLFQMLNCEKIINLPPGGDIESKHNVIVNAYQRLISSNNENNEIVS